jgi:alkaline phosphatase
MTRFGIFAHRLFLKIPFFVSIGLLITILVYGEWQDSMGNSQPRQAASPNRTAKNVILMIADGAGFNTFAAASCYEFGEPGKEVYDSFPVKYACYTQSADPNGRVRPYDPEAFWKDFRYAKTSYTDSSAAATALYTGVKTYDEAISVGIDFQPLKTIFEIAHETGRTTGVVTSMPLSDATPACAAAHNKNRHNFLAIASQMIHEPTLQVIMGCGDPDAVNMGAAINRHIKTRFDYVGGETTWESLKAGTAGGDFPWKLIRSKAEFESLAVSIDTPRRLIGIPPCGWNLQQNRPGDAKAGAFVVPMRQDVPTLATMTAGSLNILAKNPEGFCLMIEGGAVDNAAHSKQAGRLIEEMIDFNQAVRTSVAWVESHSNWNETLLIITADHETGNVWGPNSGVGSTTPFDPLVSNGKGVMPLLRFHSANHTNTLVPVFSKGAGSEVLDKLIRGQDPVYGVYVDNTDIFMVMNAAITGIVPTAKTGFYKKHLDIPLPYF